MRFINKLKNKIVDEVQYFLEINESTIWSIIIIVWLGYVLA